MSEMRFIYTLQPGEEYRFLNGHIFVTYPDRPPKIVHANGTTEVVRPIETWAESGT